MNKREIGNQKEQLAAEFLRQRGYRICEQNFYTRFGEVDLIARDPDGTLCFVEVKYRRGSGAGFPEEAVDRRKQIRICRCADYYRLKMHLEDDAVCRFDVIAILGQQIRWRKNAFDYQTGW